jgi:hypothetical protein
VWILPFLVIRYHERHRALNPIVQAILRQIQTRKKMRIIRAAVAYANVRSLAKFDLLPMRVFAQEIAMARPTAGGAWVLVVYLSNWCVLVGYKWGKK